MALKLISDHQLLNGGSKLNVIELNQATNRKIFTIELDAASIGATSFYITLNQSGTEFSVFPNVGTTCSLSPGERLTFAVDYTAPAYGATNSFAEIFCSQPIYDQTSPSGATMSYNGDIVLGPTVSIGFRVAQLDQPITRRDLGTLLLRNSNGDYIIEKTRDSFNEQSSFGLLRTNPKFTGNVKLTVDSKGDIWLNSMDAVKVLSDDRFKRYRLSPNSSYALDLKRFFDGGSTPEEIVFALFEGNSDYSTTQRVLSKQFDKFYQYGVAQENDKYYEEDFSFFAPLYLNEDVPDYFVIFRTDGPINQFSYDLPFDQWNSEVKNQILKNSRIVKTFSLGATTSIGTYLRNIVNHPARKRADLTVSFQTDGYTTFNGIAYKSGTFAQKGELLQDFFSQENPLTLVEEYITQGFQRNSVISSHIINMEYLFDDPEADEYTINRYFGLYVNAVDLASFSLSEHGLYQYSNSVGQSPAPRKGVDGTKVSDKSFTQHNPTGIRVYAQANSIKRIPEIDYELAFSSVLSSYVTGPTGFQVTLSGDWTKRMFVNDNVNFLAITGLTASLPVLSASYDSDSRSTIVEFPSSTIQDYLSHVKLNFYTKDKAEALRDSIFDPTFLDGSRFFYLKDKIGNLHTISNMQAREAYINSFDQEKVMEITLKDENLDLSTISGFTTMLTQTKAKILDTKGKAGLEVEIVSPFSPNDYLEIRWNNVVTNSGYPLRWRVQANSTSILPGDAWPFSTVSTDAEGDFYLAYFNPGDTGEVTLEVFVQSIVEAFNTFEFKDYEVVARGTTLCFRSTQEGSGSNSTSFLYSNLSPSLKFYGQLSGLTGSVNFFGGSDRKRVRAAIPKSVAEGLMTDEYMSTKGSYSIIQKNQALPFEISYGPYLEEPIYSDDDVLLEFKGSDVYRVIVLENEKQEFQTTFDGKVTSFQLFEPTFGILSVFPLRDFDNDFYNSDYTNSYLAELSHYYARDIQPLTVAGVTGSTVTFAQGATFSNDVVFPLIVPFLKLYANGSQSPDLYNAQAQLVFPSSGVTATLFLAPGSTASLAIGDLVLPMLNEKHLFFAENLLFQFKGFLSLSSIVSADDEIRFNQLQNLWDPSRFVIQLLGSEYDRMSENYLKSLVLKSRVVPYISKFVSYEGKDIRENPYRLNYHRAFGTMNFSPSLEKDQADPRFHTHEWPYLDSVPNNFDFNRFTDSAFSYFFEDLDTSFYDFSSISRDWFAEYFSVGYPTEEHLSSTSYIKTLLEPSARYSTFKREDFTGNTYTLFRGQKIQISELDSTGAVVENSTKYDGYRYSMIIRREQLDAFGKSDPIDFQTIVNEKFKFIVSIMTLRVPSFRTGFSRTRYLDLYTLENMNQVGQFVYAPSYLSNFQYVMNVPMDKNLTESINLQSYSQDPNLSSVTDFYDTINDPSNYITKINDEILPLQISGDFSLLLGFFVQTGFEISASAPKINLVYSSKTLNLSGSNAYLKFASIPVVIPIILPYSSVSWGSYTFYHQEGGNSSMIGLGNRITASEISRILQGRSLQQEQSVNVYFEGGTSQASPNFSINMVSPEKVTRTFDYIPVADNDKPSELFNYPFIGNVLSEEKDLQTLYRYQGDFVPKFRNILKFWLREDPTFTDSASQDFLFSNTHLGTELKNFSLLKNQFYSKVSDKEILRISQTSAFKSLYPYVDEISIDKKDINVWSSSWDNDYYRKYDSVSSYQSLPGTAEMAETKSMLGSKVMKTPDSYDLFQFKLSPQVAVGQLASNTSSELIIAETDTVLTMQINWGERLMREMMGGISGSTGARESFLQSMNLVPGSFDPLTLDATVKDYLTKNILNLYKVSEINLYVLETGDPGDPVRPPVEYTTVFGSDYTLNRSSLQFKKYKMLRDAKIVTLSDFVFQIPVNLDSRFYTSVSLGLKVDRI